jgi:hypothetical protein
MIYYITNLRGFFLFQPLVNSFFNVMMKTTHTLLLQLFAFFLFSTNDSRSIYFERKFILKKGVFTISRNEG